MKTLVAGLAVCWALLAASPCTYAQSTKNQCQVLRNLDKVFVVVGRLKPEIERDGLYGSTLQKDVELRLAMAGIRVLSEEEAVDGLPVPCLNLDVNAFKYCDGYAYNIELYLRDRVALLRERMQIVATVWRIPDSFGITPHLSEIREASSDMMDKFIHAWETVNAKRNQQDPRK
jgi:hypothetical protein